MELNEAQYDRIKEALPMYVAEQAASMQHEKVTQ
jgi:hypothetical protein